MLDAAREVALIELGGVLVVSRGVRVVSASGAGRAVLYGSRRARAR